MKQPKGFWKYRNFFMKCPNPDCNQVMRFAYAKIMVNAETKRAVDVKDFLRLDRGCENPFCKWSKVEEMESGVYKGGYY